jgi:acyl-CoA synthetase (AMP-forming)/AMP-acid ligase II
MTDSLSATPILDAVEALRSTTVDLDRGETVTADELRRASHGLTAKFTAGGLRRGDRAVMAIGNGPLFLATLSAVLRAGGSPIPLHADTPPPELARAAQRYGARFAVADALAADGLEAVSFRAREFAGSPPWAAGVWADAGTPDHDESSPLAGVPLHPTSGTTGEPKLAARPAAAALAEAEHYIETMEIGATDSILCTIPMSHAYGFGMCVMVPLLSGATVRSMRRVGAGDVLDVLAGDGVTIYPTTAATLDLLLLTGAGEPLAVPRCITTAGAPLPERVATTVRERCGATVHPLYGTTETGGIAVQYPGGGDGSVGAVGPPMAGVSVRLRPLATPEPAPRDDVEQLWVSSSSMMAGYVREAHLDRSPVAEGWFNTGDLARLDDRGTIILRGRTSEVINVSGNKVLPTEVEEVISLLPGVLEVKVYGARNPLGSHSVKAAVVAGDALSERDVRAHCKSHLVAYKRPVRVHMLERLPRSPAGKIVASQLP